MDIGVILFSSFWLFIIIFLAVRLAIRPLLNKQEDILPEDKDFGLVKLRDIEVFSDSELEEVIEFYNNKSSKRKDNENYHKFVRVLKELQEACYLSEDEYSMKINKLKSYFKVD